ncbi:abnormal spindle-like microcephaly-associated protein homolog [Trichogramma pretiosum]|uniref:abnormal spindle-like microcephaly-associated protein homolog n=1 Tax=Trichogramma pretiosum TaxID=7493 RepID=UPI0006C9CEA2|nr:abnormal spindle-like microcephaly-associated protein homolog [Trichogramma pretiosum]
MFFQINVTPKEKKAAEPVCKVVSSSNKYSLLLAPFQPQTKIKLDTKVNTDVKCILALKNSNNRPLNVSISKFPPPERNINISATEWAIDPESEALLEITWKPIESGSWRDILQLSDSRRIKYDVPLSLNCTDPTKKVLKGTLKTKSRPLVGSKTSCTSTSNSHKSILSNKNKQFNPKPNSQPQVAMKEPSITVGLGDKENRSSNVNTNWMLENARSKKYNEGKLPSTSSNFSKILDSTDFKFTPVKSKFDCFETKNFHETFTAKNDIFEEQNKIYKEETSTLKVETKVEMTLRKETYITVPKCLNLEEFQNSISPENIQIQNKHNDVSLFKPTDTEEINVNEYQEKKTDFSTLLSNIKFTPFKSPTKRNADQIIFSPNICSTIQKTKKTKSDNNDIVDGFNESNATFNLSPLPKADANSTYELHLPQNIDTNASYLKPTCLAKTFDIDNHELDGLKSVPINNQSHLDNSKFNINSKFSKSQLDSGTLKDCVEADLWIKSKDNSQSPIETNFMHSTLDSIKEEESDSEEMILDDSLESKPKPVRIEISPPKYKKQWKSPIRRVSPTKRSKIMKEKFPIDPVTAKKKFQINQSIKSDGSVPGIPGIKISKLSLASLMKNKDKIAKNKSCKEVSVKLHDPNDFLTMFCNPDPFAATMTHDPFLTSTLYYDDKWIYKQEIEFKKWLNALLTPPEHLTTDVDTAPIDVGKVWQFCRAKEVSLAETKEAISARYHTNTRLNSLRKAACSMYRRPDVITVLSNTTRCIEKEILIIRSDKDLHRDIGLQKIILELFISYNPLWLRIGLETIYGETIPLQSNNDLIGLSKFVINRFFSDPFLVKTHSSNLHPNIRLNTFQQLMNKFMLKKFLFLVFFLDYAKRNKLIGHDPCLFHKKAAMKDSRSVILTFSRELLSGIGDVTKVLRNYSYVVSYQQSYLDEFDYAVKDLCLDLRDGVRLCRVMELMTAKGGLTNLCRVPAISRLQRVHNVNIALNTLNEAGYTIAGDIDGKCIADGHKEKTLSLLWQIIYKFQAPRFEKAAKILQRWWRSKLWYVRVRFMLRNRKHNAASVIQRAWKCYLARRQLHILKLEYAKQLEIKTQAVCKIQLYWRMRMEVKKQQQMYQQCRSSIIKIQRWWRRIAFTKPFVQNMRLKKLTIIKLQTLWRAKQEMKLQRKVYVDLKKSVVVIQTYWRNRQLGKKVFNNYQRQRHATIFLQQKWRATLLMRNQRKLYLREIEAIKFVQAWWRSCVVLKKDRNYFLSLKKAVNSIEKQWIIKHTILEERSKFLIQKQSVRVIQRAWRNYIGTKDYVNALKLQKVSCLKIQTWWRSAREKKSYKKIRCSIIILQKRWLATLMAKRERSNFLALKKAAIVSQKNLRMKLARKSYVQQKSAVLKIENWYSNSVEARNVRNAFLEKRSAMRKIKTWWLAIKLAKKDAARYLKIKWAATIIQRRWKSQKLMKKTRDEYLRLRKSSIKIQSWWRMLREKKRHEERLRRIAATRILQMRWRALQKGREVRREYAKAISAVVLLQAKWRATLAAKAERQTFLRLRSAAIVLQKNWKSLVLSKQFKKTKKAVQILEKYRCNQLMSRRVRAEFLSLKASVEYVQRTWRTKQLRRKFLNQKRSAVVIQKYWRAHSAQQDFLRKKQAAIVIQKWRRNVLFGRQVRTDFLEFKEAAVKVQRLWRTKALRKQFTNARNAAVIIQKHWKGYVTRTKFHNQKRAATIIQRWRRHVLHGRQIRDEFLRQRNCIVKVQSLWRMHSQRRKFKEQREAAIVIQKNWRRYLAVVEYKKLRMAVMFVEKWRKCIIKARQTRQKFIELRDSVTKMQRIVRAKQLALRYQQLRLATIKIQRFWRSVLEMRKARDRYQQQRAAAITLQRRYRAWRTGYLVREDVRRTYTAVLKIQNWWRTVLQHAQRKWAIGVIENWWLVVFKDLQEQRMMWAAAVKIQAFWRGYKTRQTACKRMALLRERSKQAAEAAVPSATLAFRLQENVEIFRTASNIGQLSICLSSLDVITRLSPNACINVCQFNLVDKLYDVLTKANRSLPWLDVCLKDVSILLTLAKFKHTTKYVLKEEHIELLARLLTISVDKKDDLFLCTATLIWVLTEDYDYLEAMKNCAHSKYLLSTLYTSINKKVSKSSLQTTKAKNDAMPSPKPDWGLKHKRPRAFSSNSQAITALATRLNILSIASTTDAHKSFNL